MLCCSLVPPPRGGASLQRIQNVLLVCVQIHVSPAAKLLNVLNPSEVFPIKCPGSVIWNVFLKFFILDVLALNLPIATSIYYFIQNAFSWLCFSELHFSFPSWTFSCFYRSIPSMACKLLMFMLCLHCFPPWLSYFLQLCLSTCLPFFPASVKAPFLCLLPLWGLNVGESEVIMI